MFFLLIFPVLVAGFIACHIHPVHSYKLHRYEGQYLYLKSADLGLRCFTIGFMLAFALHYLLPDSIALKSITLPLTLSSFLSELMLEMGANQVGEADKMAWFFILSSMTVFAAFVIKMWGHINLRFRFGTWDAKVFVIGEILDDSPLDRMLFQLSLQKNKYAMISMDDRKVYVGKVISLGEPSETDGMDQDISIMPLMSGYRDKDTLIVDFTTDYEEVKPKDGESNNEFSPIHLSLRQEAIISATEFNFDAYQKWHKKKDSSNADSSLTNKIIELVFDHFGSKGKK